MKGGMEGGGVEGWLDVYSLICRRVNLIKTHLQTNMHFKLKNDYFSIKMARVFGRLAVVIRPK